MKRVKFHFISLFFVLIVAGVLRLYHLDQNPPAPYWEEAAIGYDAYSIAKTGRDFHGNFLPLLAFPSFGDFKPSGYFYATVPFVKVMGLNVLAVRLPSAIAGIISVGVMYLIGKTLFNKRVGLIASTLFAISPWSLQFSRGGWEVNLALMLLIIGSWLLIISRKKHWFLPLSVIFFGLSMYTYHAARLFAPLFGGMGGIVLIATWVKAKQLTKQNMLWAGIALLISLTMVLPLALNLKSSTVSSRFDETSIFSDPNPVLKSNKQIQQHGNTRLSRLVYNRYWYYGENVLKAFISHFSPQFLFVRGDGNLRHGTVVFGLLYPVDAIFILLAIGVMIRKKDKRLLMLFASLVFAGLSPSLVTPTPHALRFLFALPAFTLLIAFGITEFTRHCRFNQLTTRKVGVVLIYVFFVVSYLRYYHTQYPIKAAADWQMGYKEMYQKLKEIKKPEEKVYITTEYGRPSMYYLFYTSYDPAKEQILEPSLPKDQLELLRIDDYNFSKTIPQGVAGIFASSPQMTDQNAMVLATIKALDGSIVWQIWRRN